MTKADPIRAAKGPRPPRGAAFDRSAVYRLCRMLHAYLSAFAFLALMFFSITGLLLDHPEWLQGEARESQTRLTVPPSVLARARGAADPNLVLAAEIRKMTPLVGSYRSADVEDGQASLRFEGVKGASTIVLDLNTGRAEIVLERATALTMIGDLHRGKNASLPWRLVIDGSAILITALSMIGYVLFFSLRFRLRMSLMLTAASLVVLIATVIWLTP